LLAILSAIQNNSDLSQGLKPAIGSTVARKGSTLFRMEEPDQVGGNPALIGATRR
jgi:hypothetical protein